MDQGKSIFVKCNCSECSILEINYDKFIGDKGEFYFSIWVQHPGTRPMSKKERIRWCEHVMKTGQPWADHTIVSMKEAQRIAQFLNKYTSQYGKTKKDRK